MYFVTNPVTKYQQCSSVITCFFSHQKSVEYYRNNRNICVDHDLFELKYFCNAKVIEVNVRPSYSFDLFSNLTTMTIILRCSVSTLQHAGLPKGKAIDCALDSLYI